MRIKDIRSLTGLSQVKFAALYQIPRRTLEDWEIGVNAPSVYLINLLERAVKEDLRKGKFKEPKMKEVRNIWGEKVTIDELNQKLHSYRNAAGGIRYNAEILIDGKPTGFYTDYIELGTVNDIEERLTILDNIVHNQYNKAVDYDADKNDPERTLWKKIVDYVKENESAFFTKKGDWKKKIDITEKDIMAAME